MCSWHRERPLPAPAPAPPGPSATVQNCPPAWQADTRRARQLPDTALEAKDLTLRRSGNSRRLGCQDSQVELWDLSPACRLLPAPGGLSFGRVIG